MSLRRLFSCAFVLSFVPSLAWADESIASWVKHRVNEGLVKPLAKQEGGRRFSRGRPPPVERRVRALATTASVDARGRSFVPYAVDVRFDSEWSEDILGCAYRDNGALFVKNGDAYRPAAFLLGKNAEPVAGACEAAPARS